MAKYSDFKFFPRALQQTPIGQRYVGAYLRMQNRALEIKLMFLKIGLKKVPREIAEPIIHFCRREYLMYSNLAHAALDELAKTYNWPPESTADESFTWPRPVAPTSATPRRPLEHPALQPIGAHLIRELGGKDVVDGWPSNGYVTSKEPVWSVRIASIGSHGGGERFITISKLTSTILADQIYGE